MAYISITSTSSSSITAKLAGLDTGYAQSARSVDWYIDGSYEGTKSLSNGVSSGASFTFSGLDSYTTYEIEAYVYNQNGSNLLASFSTDETTDPEPPEITIDTTQSTIEVYVSYRGDFRYFKISCISYSGTEYGGSASYSTSRSKTFTELPHNTNFYVHCSYSLNGSSAYGTITRSVSTTTGPTLSVTSKTSSSITVSISNCSDFSYFKYSIQFGGTTIDDSGSYVTSKTYTFTGLAPNTSYNIFCNYSTNSSYTSHPTLGITVVTEKSLRPADFEWTYAKAKGRTFNLTATEWNNFTARINEFRVYKGLSNYSFTTAVKGARFTAAMYKQATVAIQGIPGYGAYIPNAEPGDIVTAYHLNQIRDELNAIP